MTQAFIRTAMSQLPLFKGAPGTSAARNFARDIAMVTGIPLPLVAGAERRMGMTGSLAPMRDLFASAERRRSATIQMRVQQMHQGRATHLETLTQRLTINIAGPNGALDVVITMAVLQEQATIGVVYRVRSKTSVRTFHQQVNVAADVPATRTVTVAMTKAHAA